MDSKYIKAVLSSNFRFKKGAKLIATECGDYNADFVAIYKNQLVEVEIKTSKSDLNNDFKKNKHRIYEAGKTKWTPHYFYFAVPEELVSHAVAKCVDKPYGVMVIKDEEGKVKQQYHANSYEAAKRRVEYLIPKFEEKGLNPELVGITETNSGSFIAHIQVDSYIAWGDRVRVVKRAKALREGFVDRRVHLTMVARLSSEMANLRAKECARDNK